MTTTAVKFLQKKSTLLGKLTVLETWKQVEVYALRETRKTDRGRCKYFFMTRTHGWLY